MKKTWLCLLLLLVSASVSAVEWPPVKGKPFPDLELVNQDGKRIHLADFKGKVILVEVVGMTCPACNAFSGAQTRGGYQKTQPQSDLSSIKSYFAQYAGVKWNDPRVVYVQILLFGMNMKTPSADDARKWAAHFDFKTQQREYVFAGIDVFLNSANYGASYDMIPGFFLVDKNFVVRSVSTGHHPKESLYENLLPMVPKLF